MAKIYISSTYGDLKEYREKVYHALLQWKHQVIAMEDYVASDERPLDKCLADVAGCDLYVGIFAWRYGYVPDRDNPDGLSITELEYRQAGEAGLPRLIFLLADDASWPATLNDTATGSKRAGQRIRALRKELKKDKTVSFFRNPDELANQVSRAVQEQVDRIEIHEAPPAPRPGSAPPLPGLVVGREDDLRALKTRLGIGGEGQGQGQASRPAAAGQDGPPLQILTAIRGWPGIGKTTVAAVLAHDPDVMAAFPDGVLWTSLGPDPSLFSELATWSRALGAEDLRAQTLEEASAHLAALLRGKRMLLVVDDVWQAEHARPFVAGGRGCATLITTRSSRVAQALAPTAGDVYRLPVLTEEQGLELLAALAPDVVGSHCDECRALVVALDGLPLALQVAGRTLAVEAGYGFGVADLLAELREGARLLEAQAPADRADLANESTPSVAALLQHSTDRLDETARAAFACLAVFPAKPASFDLAAMQAVCQVEDARPVARALVDRGLLEAPEAGRYQVHALLVMHARALLEQDGGADEAQRRHAEYYLKVLWDANDLYAQGGDSVQRGVALFDREWDNIQAGQGYAAAVHAEQDDAAARLCSAYPDAGVYCLELRRHPRERIAWLEAAVAAARRLKDRAGEGRHVGNLGGAYRDLGQAERAIEHHEQALAIQREICAASAERSAEWRAARRGEGACLGNLGTAYAVLGQIERAIEHLRQALVIDREIGYRRGEGIRLGNLGGAYHDLGQVERAIEQYEQALAITREIGDRAGEGRHVGNLGLAYADLGQVDRAIEHYEQALTIAHEIGDRRNEGVWLGNLGTAYRALGQAERAIKHYRQALTIAREVGDRRNEGPLLGNLGNAYRDLGQAERARECLARALAILEEIKSPDAEWARRELAELG
jgi:tetratricopeptide (TPR) repeat protein